MEMSRSGNVKHNAYNTLADAINGQIAKRNKYGKDFKAVNIYVGKDGLFYSASVPQSSILATFSGLNICGTRGSRAMENALAALIADLRNR